MFYNFSMLPKTCLSFAFYEFNTANSGGLEECFPHIICGLLDIQHNICALWICRSSALEFILGAKEKIQTFAVFKRRCKQHLIFKEIKFILSYSHIYRSCTYIPQTGKLRKWYRNQTGVPDDFSFHTPTVI